MPLEEAPRDDDDEVPPIPGPSRIRFPVDKESDFGGNLTTMTSAGQRAVLAGIPNQTPFFMTLCHSLPTTTRNRVVVHMYVCEIISRDDAAKTYKVRIRRADGSACPRLKTTVSDMRMPIEPWPAVVDIIRSLDKEEQRRFFVQSTVGEIISAAAFCYWLSGYFRLHLSFVAAIGSLIILRRLNPGDVPFEEASNLLPPHGYPHVEERPDALQLAVVVTVDAVEGSINIATLAAQVGGPLVLGLLLLLPVLLHFAVDAVTWETSVFAATWLFRLLMACLVMNWVGSWMDVPAATLASSKAALSFTRLAAEARKMTFPTWRSVKACVSTYFVSAPAMTITFFLCVARILVGWHTGDVGVFGVICIMVDGGLSCMLWRAIYCALWYRDREALLDFNAWCAHRCRTLLLRLVPRDGDDSEPPQCISCLAAQPEFMCQPCGHITYCQTCANAAQDGVPSARRFCPKCRRQVDRYEQVFW